MRSFPISPKPSAQETGNEIDLWAIFNTLQRGKWVIFFCALAMAAGTAFYVSRMVQPLYTATGTIALQSRSEQVLNVDSVVSGLGGSDLFTIYTEMEVLRARNLVAQVVDKLNLPDDPDFNFQGDPKVLSFSITEFAGDALRYVGVMGPKEEAPPPSREQIREWVITAIQGSLEITNIEFSRAYRISIATPDPQDSARIVNALAEAYILDQIAVKYEATEKANLWLLERVAKLREELEAAENAVKDFRATMTLVTPEALSALDRQAKEFRDRITATETRTGSLETRLQALRAARDSGDPARIAEVANDPALTQALRLLPDARASFDKRTEALIAQSRSQLELAQSQLVALKKSLSDIETRVETQSNDLLKLKALERDAESSRQIYEHFQTRQKETSVQQGIHTPDARLLSPALIPEMASSPRKVFSIILALLIGTILGSALVLLREMRQNGFRSPQELEQATGVNVMAQIPKAPVSKRRRLIRYLATKPSSAMAESIRNLRTSVMLSNVDQRPQVIMITSSLPGEGKTTLSMSLAQSFAGMNQRVLLIEGDIRRRVFREYFRIRNQAGLIAAVAEGLPPEEVAHHSKELGIDILASEKTSVNAADFFASGRVQEFLERAREVYDIIVIDTPPVLLVPDARVVGQFSDAVIYAVRWNRTTRAQIESGLAALASVDVKVSGLAFSQVDVKKALSYGGYYSDLYKTYGSKYYRN